MPVARGPQINARSTLIMGFTGVMIALGLGLGVIWLARSGGEMEIRLGDTDFNAGQVDRIAAEIDESGPILYSDIAGRSRDIIISHLGSDPATRWLAFAARPPGTPRSCFFRWDDAAGRFELAPASGDATSGASAAVSVGTGNTTTGGTGNTTTGGSENTTSGGCSAVTMDAYGTLSTGEVIESFPVTVDEDGDIRVDINRPRPAAPATTAPKEPSGATDGPGTPD